MLKSLFGRGNIGIPQMIKNSNPFSKKIGLVTEGIVALKGNLKVKSGEKTTINFLISVGEDKIKLIDNIKKYKVSENVEKAFELSKAKNEAETRYLGLKGNINKVNYGNMEFQEIYQLF